MKKVIGLVLVMVFACSMVAMASEVETDWSILLRASNTTYSFAASLIQVGTANGMVDGKDATEAKYTQNPGSNAQIVAYQPTWGDTPAYYAKDLRAPITAGQKITWDLIMWVGPSYTSDIARLSWWSTAKLTPNANIGGVEYTYTLSVVGDATKVWTFTPGATGAATNPAGYFDFDVANYKMADASAAANGIKLQLTAAPVPEPGSMLALGSGLVGLMGFAIRRRK